MKMILFLAFLLTGCIPACAADIISVTNLQGRVYEHIHIVRTNQDGLIYGLAGSDSPLGLIRFTALSSDTLSSLGVPKSLIAQAVQRSDKAARQKEADAVGIALQAYADSHSHSTLEVHKSQSVALRNQDGDALTKTYTITAHPEHFSMELWRHTVSKANAETNIDLIREEFESRDKILNDDNERHKQLLDYMEKRALAKLDNSDLRSGPPEPITHNSSDNEAHIDLSFGYDDQSSAGFILDKYLQWIKAINTNSIDMFFRKDILSLRHSVIQTGGNYWLNREDCFTLTLDSDKHPELMSLSILSDPYGNVPLKCCFIDQSDVSAFVDLLRVLPELKSELVRKIQKEGAQQELLK